MSTTKRAVVIGSGAGGLAAAGYLAKDGFEVQVLEQAAHLGGCLAPFFRHGFQFNPGVHSVGQCRPGQLVHDVIGGLGLDAEALFCELDPEGFDVYRFPGLEVRMCRGLDAYHSRLTHVFPRATDGLARYFGVVRHFDTILHAARSAGAGALRFEDLRTFAALPTALRWSTATFDALLRTAVPDEPRVRAVLAAACGNYGLPPSRASAAFALQVLVAYGDGAFFPRGGSAALRDALVRAAEQQGATFRARTRVARILTAAGRVVGVELAGRERVEADVVVADVDPTQTFGQLLDPAVVPSWLHDKVRRSEPSAATFTLHLGLRGDLTRFGLGRFNVWDHLDWDVEAPFADVQNGRLPARPTLFLSANSLKDDTGAMAPPGAATLEVSTFVPYTRFRTWRDLPAGERGPGYDAEKERLGAWVLEELRHRWPGLVDDVVVRAMSTPLTHESSTFAVEGGAYGPALTPSQAGFRRYRSATPVQGLFLAGAGVLGGGVAPCLLSGRVAAGLAKSASPVAAGRVVERTSGRPALA